MQNKGYCVEWGRSLGEVKALVNPKHQVVGVSNNNVNGGIRTRNQ